MWTTLFYTLFFCVILTLLLPVQKAAANDITSPSENNVADAAPLPRIYLRLPAQEKVAFNGLVDTENAGKGPGFMMYPGPNVGVFAAGIALHGLLQSAFNSNDEQKLTHQADEILIPHRAILENYSVKELLEASLSNMAERADKLIIAPNAQVAPNASVIDSTPVFFITQDKRSLILHNTISIHGSHQAKPYKNVVSVITPARHEKDLDAFWFADEGKQLKEAAARIFAQSADIALADMIAERTNAAQYKTVRYMEGGTEKMERGQLIEKQCPQLILRNLRGHIMSVPAKSECQPVEANLGGDLIKNTIDFYQNK